jgi:hypothetical protein
MSYFHFAAFSSLSDLLTFMQELSTADILIESGQLHGGEHTLLFESKEKKQRPKAATDFFATDRSPKNWLRAYHKQIHLPLTHGLLLVESTKLSSLLAFLESRPELEAHLLEITRNALPSSQGTAVFVNVDSFDTKSTPTNVTATFYAKPNQQLLSLYNF